VALTNFNNIKAAEVQLKLDQIWADPVKSKDYTPIANAVKVVLENQTAELKELEDSEKKRDVSIKWVDFCGDTAEDGAYDDTCVNEKAAEGTAKKVDVALDTFITDKFSVAIEELEGSVISYDEVVATGLAAKIKNIVERFNSKVVAAIEANRGYNPFTDGNYTVDNVTDKKTSIPAADMKAEIVFPYLAQVSALNRSNSVYLLDGGNLFQDYNKSLLSVANADGKLGAAFYDQLPYRHDLFGFAANTLSSASYLIDRGSLAIANRAKWPTLQSLTSAKDGGWIHTSNGNFMRYCIPVNIPSLPTMTFVKQGQLMKQQLLIDVQYSVVCHTDGKLYATWALKLRTGVFANPVRCNANNTGIIKLVKTV
jgi:hypothetical protein